LGTGDSVLQTQHHVSLVDLDLSQTYYFKIATVNTDNQFSFSDPQTFTTGSSFSTQAANTVKDTARTVRCWIQVNRTPAIVLGGLLGLLVIAAVVWFFMMRIWKRPTAKIV
jgi:hypothetical protein